MPKKPIESYLNLEQAVETTMVQTRVPLDLKYKVLKILTKKNMRLKNVITVQSLVTALLQKYVDDQSQ